MRAPTLAEMQPHAPALAGAVVAVVLGFGLGEWMKAELLIATTGQQLQVSEVVPRARTAFDDWQPAEGAPPPVYAMTPTQAEVEAQVSEQIGRLMQFGAGQPAPALGPGPAPDILPPARAGAYASEQGDILAVSGAKSSPGAAFPDS